MIKTKIEVVEFEEIKNLINSTAKKYNNFKDFFVVNDLKNKGKYIVYLNFYDKNIEGNKEFTQVEVIRNVLHREIETVIKNAESDFENFIGQDIIENIEKNNFVDVILKYKVNKNFKGFNLAHLKRWSGGHNARTRISDISFKITYYDPTDIYNLVGNTKTDKELYIENNKDTMLISLFDVNKALLLGKDDKSVKDMMYFIKRESDNEVYAISKYGEVNNKNWRDKKEVIEERIISSIDSKDLSDEILYFLQEEFEIVFDKKSKLQLEEELKNILESMK